MKKAQPESATQRAILAYLAARGFWAVHIPNGSKLAGTPVQRARAGKRFKDEGLYPGFPDLAVMFDGGRVGFIEVKAEGAYQQPTQKACQARMEALGHRYAVCRSIEDAAETLAKWGIE